MQLRHNVSALYLPRGALITISQFVLLHTHASVMKVAINTDVKTWKEQKSPEVNSLCHSDITQVRHIASHHAGMLAGGRIAGHTLSGHERHFPHTNT